jgi:hypothetical protein
MESRGQDLTLRANILERYCPEKHLSDSDTVNETAISAAQATC